MFAVEKQIKTFKKASLTCEMALYKKSDKKPLKVMDYIDQ